MQQIGTVEMIVVEAEDQDDAKASREKLELDVAYSVKVRPSPNQNALQKTSWALNPRSPFPHGRGVGRSEVERVVRTSEQFDLVWFFKLRTANAFPTWAWPRSVVDVDDVPSTFELSVQNTKPGPRERLATELRRWSWTRRERLLGERFSSVAVCSEADRHYLHDVGVEAPVHVIPNGYERPAGEPVRRVATPPRIGFIGIFDHAPNLAGIQWFARECWPRIKRQLPDARLRLVGRLSDGQLKPAGADIDGLGWVRDPADEMSTWSAMVVPVHVGAGTRGKIAHAFSQKCPVVSTALGAHGYDARDGHDMFLAESPEAFADACVTAIREPAMAAAMAERAWSRFLERWTWDAIRPLIWAAAEDALKSRHPPGGQRHP